MTITIKSATPDEWLPAMQLFFREYSTKEQELLVQELMDDLQNAVDSLKQLLVAKQGDDLIGVMLLQRQPDNTAFFWVPIVSETEETTNIANCLLEDACRMMTNERISYAQFVLTHEEMSHAKTLQANGFEQLAELSYLHREINEPLPFQNNIPCKIVLYDETQRQRFAKILESTYEGTLDCPAFTHQRNGEEAILSHQLSGNFTPKYWLLFEVDGEDVGLLLLNDHPDQSAFEIVYMGVAPPFRGKGYGSMMLQVGLQHIKNSDREFVLLAVDNNNHFATAIYERIGFFPLATRIIFLRNFV